MTAPAIDRMSDHQIPRIRFTFDADFGPVKWYLFFTLPSGMTLVRVEQCSGLSSSMGCKKASDRSGTIGKYVSALESNRMYSLVLVLHIYPHAPPSS